MLYGKTVDSMSTFTSSHRSGCDIVAEASPAADYLWTVGTHHHVEGTVGDVLPSEPDGDDVFPRLRRRVVDVERSVRVLHHVHVQLRPVRGGHLAGDLPFAGGLGVHRDDRLLPDLNGGAEA